MTNVVDPDFMRFLMARTGLSAQQCEHLVLEVLDQYQESLEAFVQRRHQELKTRHGLKNPQIYARIQQELLHRRFTAPPLSERQIRRLIYG